MGEDKSEMYSKNELKTSLQSVSGFRSFLS